MRSWRRWLLSASVAVGAFVACNQLVGVDDVTSKQPISDDGSSSSSSGEPLGDDDDIPDPIIDTGVPEVPHPTLALGFGHACARLLDSTVKCWGEAESGQLGDGQSLDASAPAPQDSLNPKSVPGITDAIAIASGTAHTCIVHKTGKVSCWGDNFEGANGDGTTNESSVPVDVVGVTDAINVGAGGGVTCIVHKDLTASCFGANANGGLGDGTTNPSSVPVKVQGLTNVVDILPSTNSTCAITTTGDVYCWGAGADGQLGNGSLADQPVPTKLGALSNIAKVAVASLFACALQATGSVFCWGRNDTGQLGNGSPTSAPNPSPVLVANLTDATSISPGYGHVCATKKNGQVFCWGDGSEGQLGIGAVDANGASSPVPTAVLGLTTAKSVFAGGNETCAILADNSAQCWGDNFDGEVGNGSTDEVDTPAKVNNFP